MGEDFLKEVRSAVDAILRAPEQCERVDAGPVRRYLLTRFPYAIYYRAEAERLLVLTVTHARRHPNAWKARR